MGKLRLLTLLPILGMIAGLASAKTMDIVTKKTYPIKLNGDAVTVIIGDTTVADVVAPTERLVLLSGIGPGATDLLILDEEDREILNVKVVVGISNDGILTVRRGTESPVRFVCTHECTVARQQY